MDKCSICTEPYSGSRIPKNLPCGHTFCGACLDRNFRPVGLYLDRSRACLLCKRNFQIPSLGIGALPTNYALVNLMESNELREKIQSSRMKLSKCYTLISEWVRKLNEQEKKDLRLVEDVDRDIDNTEESTKSLLDRHKHILTGQLNSMKANRIQLISEKRMTIENYLEQAKNHQDILGDLTYDISCDTVEELTASTENLIRSSESLLNDNLQPFVLNFSATNFEEFSQLGNYNFIGEVRPYLEQQQNTDAGREKLSAVEIKTKIDDLETQLNQEKQTNLSLMRSRDALSTELTTEKTKTSDQAREINQLRNQLQDEDRRNQICILNLKNKLQHETIKGQKSNDELQHERIENTRLKDQLKQINEEKIQMLRTRDAIRSEYASEKIVPLLMICFSIFCLCLFFGYTLGKQVSSYYLNQECNEVRKGFDEEMKKTRFDFQHELQASIEIRNNLKQNAKLAGEQCDLKYRQSLENLRNRITECETNELGWKYCVGNVFCFGKPLQPQ